MPDLIGTGPCLVPQRVDVMHNDVVSQREGPGISNHASDQFDAFLISRDYITWQDTIVACENCIHPTVGSVTDVTYR